MSRWFSIFTSKQVSGPSERMLLTVMLTPLKVWVVPWLERSEARSFASPSTCGMGVSSPSTSSGGSVLVGSSSLGVLVSGLWSLVGVFSSSVFIVSSASETVREFSSSGWGSRSVKVMVSPATRAMVPRMASMVAVIFLCLSVMVSFSWGLWI